MLYVIYENIYYVKCCLCLIDLYTLYSIKIVHVWYVWKCKGPMNVMVKYILFWKLSIKVYSKLHNIFPMCFGSLNGNQGPECIGVLTSIKGSMGVTPDDLPTATPDASYFHTRLPPRQRHPLGFNSFCDISYSWDTVFVSTLHSTFLSKLNKYHIIFSRPLIFMFAQY